MKLNFNIRYPKLMEGFGERVIKVARRLRIATLTKFARYMRQVILQQFKDAGHGGTHRGVNWDQKGTRFPESRDHFAPLYKRKDGTLVPAWGGISAIIGRRRMVKGRLRHSGQHVKQKSNVMQDTGELMSQAGRTFHITGDKNERVWISTKGRAYFSIQHDMRPWMFFTQVDLDNFRQMAIENFKQFREIMARNG